MPSTACVLLLVVLCISLSNAAFQHPGVVHSTQALNFIKSQVQSNTNPWKADFTAMTGSSKGSTSGNPSYWPPPSVIACPVDDICEQSVTDAEHAFTTAVAFWVTGEQAYCTSTINYLNTYARNVKSYLWDGSSGASTSILYAAWVAQLFTRTAEILRYAPGTTWSATDAVAFEGFLNKVFLPLFTNGWGGANWDMSFAEAILGIGVYTNNQTTYDHGLFVWRNWTQGYIYMTKDGSQPNYLWRGAGINSYQNKNIIGYWASTFAYQLDTSKGYNKPIVPFAINGIEQETCRDLGHPLMALESIVNGAETARIHGDDLYTEQQDRILATYELHAEAMYYNVYTSQTTSPPGWPCILAPIASTTFHPANNAITIAGLSSNFETFYNHYNTRMGVSAPKTLDLLTKTRPLKIVCAGYTCWTRLMAYQSPSDLGGGSAATTAPTKVATKAPTSKPTIAPTKAATKAATKAPTIAPTVHLVCTLGGTSFQTGSYAAQTSALEFTFMATSAVAASSSTFGLSSGSQTAYTSYPVIMRFGSGVFQAYNGLLATPGYTASSNVATAASTVYTFKFSVNIKTQKYNLTVSSAGSATYYIAFNYGFRTAVTSLDHYGFKDVNAQVSWCNFALTGSTSVTPPTVQSSSGNNTSVNNTDSAHSSEPSGELVLSSSEPDKSSSESPVSTTTDASTTTGDMSMSMSEGTTTGSSNEAPSASPSSSEGNADSYDELSTSALAAAAAAAAASTSGTSSGSGSTTAAVSSTSATATTGATSASTAATIANVVSNVVSSASHVVGATAVMLVLLLSL